MWTSESVDNDLGDVLGGIVGCLEEVAAMKDDEISIGAQDIPLVSGAPVGHATSAASSSSGLHSELAPIDLVAHPPPLAPHDGPWKPVGPFPGDDVTYYFDDGHSKITWYKKLGIFEAVCPNKKVHGPLCRKTLSSLPPKGRYILWNPWQGRCLGYLLAWVQL